MATVKAAKARTGITDPSPLLKHIHLFEVYNAGRAATAALLAFFSFFLDTMVAALPLKGLSTRSMFKSGIAGGTKPLQRIEVIYRA